MYTLAFLTAKLLDIGLVTVYYFLAAFTLSRLVDLWMGPFDEEKARKRHILSIIAEVVFQFFLLGVLTYIMRNLVERIPFPLEGFGYFHHHRLKELHDAGVFVVVFLFYQEHLALNLKYLAGRISGHADEENEKKIEHPGLGQFI
jgi:phosphate starvation-inducible membrane PsiE